MCLVIGFFVCQTAAAVSIRPYTASGGLTISGSYPNYSVSFGAVNGLGLGTPKTGLTILPITGSSVYYVTNVGLTVAGGSGAATVTAALSSSFSTSVFTVVACAASACNTPSLYFPITSSVVIYDNVPNGSFVFQLGVAVQTGNGALFPASGAATLRIAIQSGASSDQFTLALSPNVYTQGAVGLTLASSGGLTISAASDYSTNFGTLNGLGLTPPAGVTVVARPGGVLFATPYRITPQFAGFADTTGTVSSWVSSPFAASTELYLCDAGAVSGPWTTISTTSASPTVLSAGVAHNVAITRYLGLFVSSVNSASAVPGNSAGGVAVNATQTVTLTVP